ncbi:sugar transferase [Millisia brevis]|uniref:sugar transferase n=1 Tax=Millisia brevis TaxID=264148 RepID=UPI00147111E0|nr:sugar transferase [Millisia brevis]
MDWTTVAAGADRQEPTGPPAVHGNTDTASRHEPERRQRRPGRQVERPRIESISGVRAGLIAVECGSLVVAYLLSHVSPTPFLIFAAVLIVGRSAVGFYRPRLHLSVIESVPAAIGTLAGATLVPILLLPYIDPGASPLDLANMVAIHAMLSLPGAVIAFAAGRWVRRSVGRRERTIILGAGLVGQGLARTMHEYPEFGLEPIGFIDPDPRISDGDALPAPLLSHDPGDLEEIAHRTGAGSVIISFAVTKETDLVDTAIAADQLGCRVFVVPRLFELHRDGRGVERIRGYPLIHLNSDPTRSTSWWIKRAADVAIAVATLVLILPVLIACAAAILIDSGRPIFFGQERIGRNGSRFTIYKFRSMRQAPAGVTSTTWSAADDPRVGRVGAILRRTSLDELPQLWNIVRGEMSIVGPRPERPHFVEQFEGEHDRYWARHRVTAGLTGWAQVNGLRGDTSILERARFDNYYIANWSLWLDAKIVLMTVRQLFRSGRH